MFAEGVWFICAQQNISDLLSFVSISTVFDDSAFLVTCRDRRDFSPSNLFPAPLVV